MKVTALTDLELLGRLIGKRASSRAYAGSLRELFQCGGSDPSVEKLIIARELVMRSIAEELKREAVFQQPMAVRNYLRVLFSPLGHEVFVVMFLDAQHRLIAAEEVFRGTLTQTSVYPREIVKRALSLNAAAVILAHNHPSGVAEPSMADEALTVALKAALALVDVRVLDHFIVGGGTMTSFAERGLL